jgi:hypothetical protein
MEELGQRIGNMIAGFLVKNGAVALAREDIESDRAGRYVVKLQVEDWHGGMVEVEVRIGVS